MRRRRMISAISILTLTASMLLALGFAPGVAGATELRFCGKVDVYTRPTALLAGTLKVGPVLLVLAPGADVSSRVEVGANLCFDATINASGKVTDLEVRANATSSLTVCGVVTSLTRATASATGSITINGVHRILAIGSDLPATVRQGANLCVDFTLNAFGQVSRATARANATSTLNICGRVTAFAAASNTSTGSLTLGGRTFRLAVGADLPASVRAGADLCMALELNALGQVSGGSARANVTTTVTVCGQVNAVVAATATSDGRLVIDDVPRSIAAGERLSAQVRAGAFVRLRLTLDAFGRITDDVVLAVGVSRAAACGSGGAPSPSASPSAGPTDEPGTSPSQEPSTSPSATASGGAGGGAGAASPSASPRGDGTGAPGGSRGGGDIPGGTGGTDGAPAGQPGCTPAGEAAGRGGEASAPGGALPDTASLARAGSVIARMAVPLLVMILGLLGYVAWQVHDRRGGIDQAVAS